MARIGVNYNLLIMNKNLAQNRESHSNAIIPISTGRRINNLGDDPTQLAEYFRLQGELSRIDQYTFNINTARTRVNITDSVLGELYDVSNELYELGIQGNNGSLTAGDIANISNRLDDLNATALDLANTRMGNNYIFAGFKSTTQPFDGTPGTFNGDSNDIDIKVTATRSIKVSVDGDALFTGGGGNTDIFQTISDLKTAIQAQDSAAIGTALTNLQAIQAQISESRGSMGSALNDLTSSESFLNSLELNNSERLSVISEIDIAEASTELSYREFAMKAAFAVANRVMEISLQSFFT